MMEPIWDNVLTEFSGEETVNFGARDERGSALYQVDTMATISARGNVVDAPAVCAIVAGLHFCAAAGKQLSLFDQNASTFLTTLDFDSDIETIASLDDTEWIVVGLNNGTLHFVSILHKVAMFSQKVLLCREGETSFQCIQTTTTSDGMQNLLISGIDGTLLFFPHMDISSIITALENKDFAAVKKFQKEMTRCCSPLPAGSSALRHDLNVVLTTTGSDSVGMGVWSPLSVDASSIHMTIHYEELCNGSIVKCIVSRDCRYLLTLDSSNALSVWDAQSMIMLRQWNELPVTDFTLIEEFCQGEISQLVKIIILTPASDGHAFLQVHSFPDFELVYSLKVGCSTTLVQSNVDQEEIIFVEGVAEDGADVPSCLRVRLLTEALPQTRLVRLLQRHKFDEALRFVNQFRLDPQRVHQARAQWLLNEGDYTALITCLDLIHSKFQVVDLCVMATPSDFQVMLKLLLYAKAKLCDNNNEDSAKDTNTQSLLVEALQFLQRLETFAVAYGEQSFSSSRWSAFTQANMLQEFIGNIVKGQTATAFVIWGRHNYEFVDDITEDLLDEILSSFPYDVPMSHLQEWCRDELFLLVAGKLPKKSVTVAQWLEARVRGMEFAAAADRWPHSAISVLEYLLTNRDAEADAQLCDKRLEKGWLAGLQMLCHSLRMLADLHATYNCRLTLDEYMQENVESLAYRMLDKVKAVDVISRAIDRQVRPYVKQHGLSEEKVLLQYVVDLAQRPNKSAHQVLGSSWETRAIAVVNAIGGAENKCRATAHVLRKAGVPLSPDMAALVNAALALRHPLAAELDLQLRLVRLKEVLCRYDLGAHNVAEAGAAHTFTRHVVAAGRESAVADALVVVRAYPHLREADAYAFHARLLVSRGEAAACIELLRGLPAGDVAICARRVATACAVVLNDAAEFDEEGRREKVTFTRAAVEVLRCVSTWSSPLSPDLLELLQEMETISALQIEFGLFLTLEDFQSTEFKKNLLDQHLMSFHQAILSGQAEQDHERNHSRRKGVVSKWRYTGLYRVAELLGVSHDELTARLATTEAQAGRGSVALALGTQLAEGASDGRTARLLYPVVHALMRWQSCTASELRDLVARVLACCHADLLPDCLELFKAVQMACVVQTNCEEAAGHERVCEYGWIEDVLFNTFKEDGSLMRSKPVLALTHDFAMACVPSPVLPRHPYVQERTAARSMLLVLRDTLGTVAGSTGDAATSKTANSAGGVATTAKAIDATTDDKAVDIHFGDELVATAIRLIQYFEKNSLNELAFRQVAMTMGCLLRMLSAQEMGYQTTDRTYIVTLMAVREKLTRHLTELKKGMSTLSVPLLEKICNKLKKLASRSVGRFNALMAVAQVGTDFARVVQEPKILDVCEKLKMNAYWGSRLSKLNIPYGDALKGSQESKEAVLPDMVRHPHVDVAFVTAFCEMNGLNVGRALLLFLERVLLHDDDRCRGDGDHPADERAEARMRAVRQVFAAAADSRLDAAQLDATLDLALLRMCPYDHDLLAVVLERLAASHGSAARRLSALTYLRKYRRTAPPSEYETNYSSRDDDDGDMLCLGRGLPAEASVRLPFHPLVLDGVEPWNEPWKIITPELNADTVKTWVAIASVLALSKDQVYLTAVRNIVSAHCKELKSPSGTSVQSDCDKNPDAATDKKPRMIDQVQELLSKVVDQELVLACMRWIVKVLPMGQEKVLALQACMQLAQNWCDSCKDDKKAIAERAWRKFTDAWRRLSTEQILHEYGLAETAYVALTGHPVQLVFKLYEHGSISERILHPTGQFPDIHEAVEKISSINRLELKKIRLVLLKKWLLIKNKADDVVAGNPPPPKAAAACEEDDTVALQRAVYQLQHDDSDASAQFLVAIAYGGSASACGSRCCARALECLLALYETSRIEELLKCPIGDVKEQLRTLVYVTELEQLHVPMTAEAFRGLTNKEGLVHGIWRNHCHEPAAAWLVSRLCVDFGVWDVSIWASLLHELMSAGENNYVRRLLRRITAITGLWGAPAIGKAWRYVILEPLTATAPPLDKIQIRNCLKIFQLVLMCPLRTIYLDLSEIAHNYQRLELETLAQCCLALIPDVNSRTKMEIPSLAKQNLVRKQLQEFYREFGDCHILQKVELLLAMRKRNLD
ncbi:PREDICTED: kinetochore-associated protein 1-like [Priapulus caudatus]|uniref:Kinetochore-associated protein 1-like n=1 Tax=Priapulus caudatus TaxID=37621 RepID=A0ABM1DZ41_PRICU|nr:PREDICTED: kinetochore-associated protein 1-like [Priapulus caudatus]